MDGFIHTVLWLCSMLSLPSFTNILTETQIKSFYDAYTTAACDDSRLVLHDEDDEPARAFIEWMNTVGIITSGIKFFTLAPGIRGLKATRDWQPEEIMVKVPYNAVLNDIFKSDNPIIKAAEANFSEQTAVFVIGYQEMKNKKSRFLPYFGLFPKDFSNFPTLYSDEELAMLQGTDLLREINERRQIVKEVCDQVKEAIPELRNVSNRELYTTYETIFSRTFVAKQQGKHKLSLVPMFDMFNSNSFKRAELNCLKIKLEEKEKMLTMRTTRAIKKGEEVFFSYGMIPTSTQLLMLYGFIYEDIPEVSYKFWIGLDEDDIDAAIRLQVLQRLMGAETEGNKGVWVKVANSSDERTYEGLYSAARIKVLDDERQIQKILNDITRGNMQQATINQISVSSEIKAMELVYSLILERQQKYTTTIEEDEKLLPTLQMYSNVRNIVLVRKVEKELLQRIEKHCSEALTKLTA